MVKNFWYLFAAYAVIWTAIFSYMVYLSNKNRVLRDDLRDLQAQVQRLLEQKKTT